MAPANGPESKGPESKGPESNGPVQDGSAPARSNDRDGVISPLRFLSGGIEFAVTCAIGALVGRWLDSRFGTEPWLTAGLLIVAFATATWLLLRSLSKAGGGSGGDTTATGGTSGT